MKKHIIPTLLIAALVALPQLAPAAAKDPANFGGKVAAVGAGTITVSNKKKGDQTFKTDAATKYVNADGSAATASDIKVGERVQVIAGATADQAATVTLQAGGKKGAPKTPAKDAGKTTPPAEKPKS